MNAPELTPERLSEIRILLVVAGVLIAFIASPFVLSWWLSQRVAGPATPARFAGVFV